MNSNSNRDYWGAIPEEVIQNSGKTLSGDFGVQKTQDEYRTSSAPLTGPQAGYTFSTDGTFKRVAVSGSASVEEGTYLIGVGGELVLYVEKTNGQPLSEARREVYHLEEKSGGAIELGLGPGSSILLVKK